jgi:predicted alpha/beta-fold hydrolase
MTINAFKPAWWLRSRHLQTLWPTYFRRQKTLALRRERIELPDGDFIDLDWTTVSKGPTVLVLHGLEGSANSSYAHGMLHALTGQGYQSAVMHFRSCSGEINRLPRTYHSGETTDLAAIVKLIQARDPLCPLAIVGFSLGANVLLKWLGETGDNNPLTAAVAISAPFDLGLSVDYLQAGFSRIYDRHLLRSVQNKFRQKISLMPPEISHAIKLNYKTLREFDDRVTAPLHGFLDGEDYYTRASCKPFLPHITVPTLIINSKDDPFIPESVIPSAHEVSPQVRLEVYSKGGHVGFVAGSLPWRARYWLDERVPQFLQGFL